MKKLISPCVSYDWPSDTPQNDNEINGDSDVGDIVMLMA